MDCFMDPPLEAGPPTKGSHEHEGRARTSLPSVLRTRARSIRDMGLTGSLPCSPGQRESLRAGRTANARQLSLQSVPRMLALLGGLTACDTAFVVVREAQGFHGHLAERPQPHGPTTKVSRTVNCPRSVRRADHVVAAPPAHFPVPAPRRSAARSVRARAP